MPDSSVTACQHCVERRVYVEVQYDARRGHVALSASPGFGKQAYLTGQHVSDEQEAVQAFKEFVQMYRDLGVTVVTNRGEYGPTVV